MNYWPVLALQSILLFLAYLSWSKGTIKLLSAALASKPGSFLHKISEIKDSWLWFITAIVFMPPFALPLYVFGINPSPDTPKLLKSIPLFVFSILFYNRSIKIQIEMHNLRKK